MDLMSFLGLIIGVGAVWFVLSSGGILHLLFNLNAAILVFGGVFGAILITYPWNYIKKIPKAIFLIFFPKRLSSTVSIVSAFENLSKRLRREGISNALLEGVPAADKFFRKAVQLLIDGFDKNFIEKTLRNEIKYFKERHNATCDMFKTMGAYAPIFGLLGTLIGVVQVLQNLTDPQSMGASMAIAITTTFYGIFSTNFLFLPIAGKLAAQTQQEVLLKEIVLEGALGLKDGDVPQVLREKLNSFVAEYGTRRKR